MHWDMADYMAAALILCAAGLGLWASRRMFRRRGLRRVATIVVIVLAALVWAELAVGLFH